ncbi:MAG: chemotaxis protein CheW [Clostridia bacterium]|nr:chemotaxis protein CheW [Clostridia bacterium]
MEQIQVVAFKLGNEEYAIDVMAVQEIIRPTAITRVPRTKDFYSGVINLRGNVVPIVNLAKRFNLEEVELTEKSRIIILNVNDIRVGITVESVTEVININKDDIETPNLTNVIDEKFIAGVAKYQERLLILLNIEEVLELTEVAQDTEEIKG